ncbi:MAG: type I DNA topoisomerase [Clostridiales bacterium]|nr:type I DNA topoisomerase [Clostridiales bacterium]
MKTLIIVESPTKAKTIEKFLGKQYTVKSCMGHIRDLPKSSFGVDVEHDFAPHYITIRGKGDVIKTLRDESKKADNILLASDPDREGEAIAWHLQQYLGVKNPKCRIRFNEITGDAVKKAVQQPTAIDIDKVDAQQARRILDRLVGYKLSPLLWKKLKKGLSAGRVQTVAVRLICDREQEIREFVAEEYWTLTAYLQAASGELVAKLLKIDGAKAVIGSRQQIDDLLTRLKPATFIVNTVNVREKKKGAAPPFTTSTLQQEAARRLSMAPKKTMQTAQQLYEGIAVGGVVTGLISYMRTDSVRVSDDAIAAARQYIDQKYGKDYLPGQPNKYSSGKGRTQDAHEAIRPTQVDYSPQQVKAFLTPPQYKLYKLIWERFVASQMSQAIYDVHTVDVEAAGCLFRASGSILKFAGYTQVYNEKKEDREGEKEEHGIIVPVKKGEALDLNKLAEKQHFTQPPPRFNEATLIKAMEELAIGRPSTYAPTIDTILFRSYVAREEKQLFPTELGQLVVDMMKEYFPNIVDVDFTAEMERQLDEVEEGREQWVEILREFYGPFAQTLEYAEKEMEKIVIEPEQSDEVCEKCGKPMVYRLGRYGRFLACSGFPECRNTKAIVIPTNVKCLACGGNILQRKSRTGRIFYGCDKYPECSYVAWDLPIEEKCPTCGTQLSLKKNHSGQEQKICPNRECPDKQGKEKKSKGRPKKDA